MEHDINALLLNYIDPRGLLSSTEAKKPQSGSNSIEMETEERKPLGPG